MQQQQQHQQQQLGAWFALNKDALLLRASPPCGHRAHNMNNHSYLPTSGVAFATAEPDFTFVFLNSSSYDHQQRTEAPTRSYAKDTYSTLRQYLFLSERGAKSHMLKCSTQPSRLTTRWSPRSNRVSHQEKSNPQLHRQSSHEELCKI